MEDLIRQAEGSNTLRSGLASKMFGLMNFLEQGMCGRVGCGGLAALCDRQGTVITDELRDCFHLIRAILQLRPERHYPICQPPVPRKKPRSVGRAVSWWSGSILGGSCERDSWQPILGACIPCGALVKRR